MSHKFAKSFFALLTAIGLALTVSYATAQSNVSGSISGTVMDATGAVVSGAAVTITNTDRGEDIRVTKTNATGFFTEEALPLGNYKVTIVAAHFKTEVVTGLVLHAADELTVDRKLTPGGANEIVTVTTTDNLVNVESGRRDLGRPDQQRADERNAAGHAQLRNADESAAGRSLRRRDRRPDARSCRPEWRFEHGVVLSERRPQHFERLDD